MSSFRSGAFSGKEGMTHVPSAGGSRLRSKRSSIRRTSEVEVNRIPLDKRLVTLIISPFLQIGREDVHLSQSNGIRLDGINAQPVDRFSDH